MTAESLPTELRSIVDRHEPLVVCVYPVTGEADAFDGMAKQSRSRASFVGVARSPGVRESFTEISSRVAEALRCQPRRRLVLLGASTGAMLAADIVAQLESLDIAVERLIVIEGRVTVPEMRQRLPSLPSVHRQVARILCERAGLEFSGPNDQGGYEFVRERALIAHDKTRAEYESWVADVRAAAHAYMTHTPRCIAAPTTVLVGDEDLADHPRPPSLGWENLSAMTEQKKIPGNHFSVLAHRYRSELAAAVDACLNTG